MSFRSLLVALAAVLLCAPAAALGAERPLDRLPSGLQAGIFSPDGAAAAERAQAPFGLRYLYVTSGVGNGRLRRPGAERARWVSSWLEETRREKAVPVLTYYQLQPSAPSGGDERARTRSALRSRRTMRAYWRDVRDTLRLAAVDRGRTVILHIEPDNWEFIEQLQGAKTRAQVSSTGLKELRGLPNNAKGYARAFQRLRNRYAPNVALAFHLSAFGVGQVVPGSIQNSKEIGEIRAKFIRSLGARFDLALTDPSETNIVDAFDEHLALMRSFHARSRLPLMLWQLRGGATAEALLGADAAARRRLAAERAAGVLGFMFDVGEPGKEADGRDTVLRLAGAAYRDGRLG